MEKKSRPTPHPCMDIKNWKGYLRLQRFPWRTEWSQPHTECHSPDHLCQEEESPQHAAMKISKNSIWVRQRCWSPRHPLKGPTHSLTSWWMYSLSSSTRQAAAQKVPRTYGEEPNYLTSGRGLKGSSLYHFVSLLRHTLAQSASADRCKIWVSIKLTPPWWFPENPPHPTHPPEPLSAVVIHKQLASVHAVDFPKMSARSTNPQQNKQWLALECSTSC